ncbi:MAG TPA: SAM-dependent methyltransferase [Acidimicrobiia bacterium]
MAECCDPAAYGRIFDSKEAERRLRRYRRKGLDRMAARLLGYLQGRDLVGRTILEVGGGIGDFQVELLKSGAAGATNVELSGAYERTARELSDEENLTDRVERRLGDFVEEQQSVEPADLVVLNRVICCYPWMDRLMEASVAKTNWLLAIAVPRDRLVSRIMVKVGNAILRLRGQDFDAYVHSVAGMEAIAARAGLTRVFIRQGLVWEGLVFERL